MSFGVGQSSVARWDVSKGGFVAKPGRYRAWVLDAPNQAVTFTVLPSSAVMKSDDEDLVPHRMSKCGADFGLLFSK